MPSDQLVTVRGWKRKTHQSWAVVGEGRRAYLLFVDTMQLAGPDPTPSHSVRLLDRMDSDCRKGLPHGLVLRREGELLLLPPGT